MKHFTKSHARKFARIMCDCENPLIFSFNFTMTLPLLRSVDRLSSDFNVIYVHGCIESENIVLGISDAAKINHPKKLFLKKAANPNYPSGNRFINSLALSNVKGVHIYGLSLGESDHTYFKEHFANLVKSTDPDVRTYVYYYGAKGRLDLLHQIDILSNNQLSRLFDSKKLVMIDNKA